MNGKFLLDTNIVIALFADDKSVADKIRQSTDVYTSSVVAGELYYGAMHSSKVTQNVERLEAFLNTTEILFCDIATSKLFGTLKAGLRTKGTPIPDNDIWIAATAIQHSLRLATRDDHFLQIDDLNTQRW